MKNILKYSGIAALSITLIMLSLGSISQAQAQTVASSMTVDITCGADLLNGNVAWTNVVVTGVTLDSEIDTLDSAKPTVENTGSAVSVMSADAGDNTNGGYAGTTDLLTHIAPSQMALGFVGGSTFNLLDTGFATGIGSIGPTTVATMHWQIDTTLFGASTSDTDWAASVDLFVVCFTP